MVKNLLWEQVIIRYIYQSKTKKIQVVGCKWMTLEILNNQFQKCNSTLVEEYQVSPHMIIPLLFILVILRGMRMKIMMGPLKIKNLLEAKYLFLNKEGDGCLELILIYQDIILQYVGMMDPLFLVKLYNKMIL